MVPLQDALREVRIALLEADVALPVVRHFIDQVRAKALGQEVVGSLTPGQALIGVVHRELTPLMGEANAALNLVVAPPAVILKAGLQGSGKTTTVGKLALYLKGLKKKVLVASCDVYRPAAIEQLAVLAAQVGCEVFPSAAGEAPVAIAAGALDWARRHYHDVPIVDTAGRLACASARPRSPRAASARTSRAQVAAWIADVLDAVGGEAVIGRVREQVLAICHRFPVYR